MRIPYILGVCSNASGMASEVAIIDLSTTVIYHGGFWGIITSPLVSACALDCTDAQLKWQTHAQTPNNNHGFVTCRLTPEWACFRICRPVDRYWMILCGWKKASAASKGMTLLTTQAMYGHGVYLDSCWPRWWRGSFSPCTELEILIRWYGCTWAVPRKAQHQSPRVCTLTAWKNKNKIK